ncbi:MAG: MFS transporter [Chloroflexi bacterium]|nr:MFS transporter [Chloroflexota bacterium]
MSEAMQVGGVAPATPVRGGARRAWLAVVACLLCTFVADGIGYYSFGVFFTPLLIEFDLNRATTAGIFSFYGVCGALGNVVVGRAMDRWGPRPVMLWGAVVMGLSFSALFLVQSVWHVYVLYGVAAFGRAGIAFVPVGGVVSRLFRERRGLALGISMTGVSLGGMVMVPLLGFLVEGQGWRLTYAMMGLLVWLVVLPAVGLLIPAQREMDRLARAAGSGRARAGEGQPAVWSLRAALGGQAFWMLAAAFLFASMTSTSIVAHLIPYFTDRGISPQDAAVIVGSLAGMGIVAKLVSGYLSDRITARWVLVGCLALEMAGIVILMQVSSLSHAWAFVPVFALGQGAAHAIQPLLVTNAFGVGSFGSIYGVLTIANTVGGVVGNPLAGYIFDVSGSYLWAFVLFLAANSAGIALLALLRPARQPGAAPTGR